MSADPRREARMRTTLVLIGAAAVTIAGGAAAQTRTETPGPLRRAGEFRIEVRIAVPAGAQSLELWIPAPRVDDAQSVVEAAAPTPPGGVLAQETDRERGNTFLHLKMAYPQGTVVFAASWKLERRESTKAPFRRGAVRDPTPAEKAVLLRDIAASELRPASGRLKTRASLIAPAEDDPLNVGRAIYDEVLRTIAFAPAGEGRRPGDPLFALDAGHGEAADFAALFVGLAHARGIPARYVLGYPLPEARPGAESEIQGYAAWAEFFVPDLGWIPVDLATAKAEPALRQYCFGSLNERRIQFTAGRDVPLAPPSKRGSHPDIIYPHAEIDGEPTTVAHKATFKEKSP